MVEAIFLQVFSVTGNISIVYSKIALGQTSNINYKTEITEKTKEKTK